MNRISLQKETFLISSISERMDDSIREDVPREDNTGHICSAPGYRVSLTCISSAVLKYTFMASRHHVPWTSPFGPIDGISLSPMALYTVLNHGFIPSWQDVAWTFVRPPGDLSWSLLYRSAVWIQELISPWHISPANSSLRQSPYSSHSINILPFIMAPEFFINYLNPAPAWRIQTWRIRTAHLHQDYYQGVHVW